jgi:hypothetical protein
LLYRLCFRLGCFCLLFGGKALQLGQLGVVRMKGKVDLFRFRSGRLFFNLGVGLWCGAGH